MDGRTDGQHKATSIFCQIPRHKEDNVKMLVFFFFFHSMEAQLIAKPITQNIIGFLFIKISIEVNQEQNKHDIQLYSADDITNIRLLNYTMIRLVFLQTTLLLSVNILSIKSDMCTVHYGKAQSQAQRPQRITKIQNIATILSRRPFQNRLSEFQCFLKIYYYFLKMFDVLVEH